MRHGESRKMQSCNSIRHHPDLRALPHRFMSARILCKVTLHCTCRTTRIRHIFKFVSTMPYPFLPPLPGTTTITVTYTVNVALTECETDHHTPSCLPNSTSSPSFSILCSSFPTCSTLLRKPTLSGACMLRSLVLSALTFP